MSALSTYHRLPRCKTPRWRWPVQLLGVIPTRRSSDLIPNSFCCSGYNEVRAQSTPHILGPVSAAPTTGAVPDLEGISIVLPARNEVANIASAVEKCLAVAERLLATSLRAGKIGRGHV